MQTAIEEHVASAVAPHGESVHDALTLTLISKALKRAVKEEGLKARKENVVFRVPPRLKVGVDQICRAYGTTTAGFLTAAMFLLCEQFQGPKAADAALEPEAEG